MVTPLLQTKLNVPVSRPGLVSRPRLIERLDAGLERKLTLVSAPAGFGKTTLLIEWAVRLGPRQTAWISLDEGDNDPTRFLAYLIGALRSIDVGFGENILSALHAPQQPPVELILTALINEMVSVPPENHRRPILLVLDDYHLISAQPVHAALTFLLEHSPPQLHIVVATRADPPLPVTS